MNRDKSMKIRESIKFDILRIYETAISEMWTMKKILDSLKGIWSSDRYKSIQNQDKQFLDGYRQCLRDRIDRELTEFSYVHNGKRYVLGTEEYKAIDPREINTETGAFVWLADTSKVYYP